MPERLVIAVKPHVLTGFVDGWKPKTRALSNVSAAQIGRVLLNHLMAEHYIDACLSCIADGDVDWDAARLSFAQKLSLLSGKGSVLGDLGLVPGLRRMNKIRNETAHQLEVQLTAKDVAPMRDYLRVHAKKKGMAIPSELDKILDTFTALACASMLGFIAGHRAGRHLRSERPSSATAATGG